MIVLFDVKVSYIALNIYESIVFKSNGTNTIILNHINITYLVSQF